eukprot:c5349_g1_i1 orf=443-4852(+)
MPLSLAKGVCATSIPTILMRSCCPEWSDKGFSGISFPYRDKIAAAAKSPLYARAPHSPRRHGSLRKRSSRIVGKMEGVSTLNDVSDRHVKAQSLRDPHTLVLDRGPDDTETTTGSSIDWRKIEVVGQHIDLDDEVRLLRQKGKSGTKKKRKPREVKMKLEALQLQTTQIEDAESRAALVTKEVQLRSEGDAENLAEPIDTLHEGISSVLRESQENGRSTEVLSEDQDANNVTVEGAGLVPYRDHWPTSFSALPGGGQLVAELTTAWDGLAGRLSPSITSGKHMQQILSALKLAFATLNRASEDGRLMLVNSLSIAYTLADLQMDATVMAAGLLRSAVEAGLVGVSLVEQQLGSDVGRLLHDCMRFKRTLDQMDLFDEESAKAVRQFCLSYHDIRAITIEFSVRLQQMRHVHDLPSYQQQILALEALQIHAPLAHAIGTKEVSTELEDLAFKVILPDSYEFLNKWLLSHWPDENSVLEECKLRLSTALEQDEKLKSLTEGFTMSGRLKSRFSIMKKMLKDGRKPEEVYDIMGLRVVMNCGEGLESVESGQIACYRVLEIVRSLWKEVPGRLKDYIANPKSNGYESLHVAVYLTDSCLKQPSMELQIRTSLMDFKANAGDASHSLYKGGLTDPEQVQQLKKLMMAAADRAAWSLKELTGESLLTSAPANEDQVFLLFDKNNDGRISMSEFQQVLGDLGVDGKEAHEVMQLVDADKDGSVSADEFAEFKKQVSFLEGFDKRFIDRLGNTLRGSYPGSTPQADQCAFSSTSVEIGHANSKVKSACAVSQSGTHSSDKALVRENSSQSLEDRLQSGNEVLDASVQTSFISSSEGKLADTVSTESSSSRSEVEALGMERRELASRSKDIVSSSSSSVVLKKPVTVSRPMFEEEVNGMADLLNTFSDSNEDTQAGARDLTTGLTALRRLIFRKHFDLAKDLAKELYEQYPGDTDVLLEYAHVQRQLGDLVAAGALYSQAISTFEDQQNLGYEYVRALQALGSIEARARNAKRARVLFMESIRAARQAERFFPEMVSGASVYGLHAWAKLEEQLGNWAKARDLLARAAEIQPGNAVIHQSRALLEAKAHNWGAARHHFSLAVEAAPKDIKCWHAWAIFEGGQGKHNKMRQLFQRALEVDPNSVHCLQAWAHQETLIGTPESIEKARSLFQSCTQIEPKSLFSWQAWAVLEKSSGNYEKAQELFEKCLEINSSSVACLQAFANMQRILKNWGAAQRLLRKALKVEPENAAVLMEAALVEKGLGNNEVAEKLFVLAGMADKRKSKVRNKIFASRKEVMPHKAGRGWRASGKKNIDNSFGTESNFKIAIDAIKAKQKELKYERNVNTDKQTSSHSEQGESDGGGRVWRASGKKDTDYHFKTAINALKAKQKEPKYEINVNTDKQTSSHSKQGESCGGQVRRASGKKDTDYNFKTAIDAIKAKQKELNGEMNVNTEKQPSIHLKQGEGGCGRLGARSMSGA